MTKFLGAMAVISTVATALLIFQFSSISDAEDHRASVIDNMQHLTAQVNKTEGNMKILTTQIKRIDDKSNQQN